MTFFICALPAANLVLIYIFGLHDGEKIAFLRYAKTALRDLVRISRI